MKIASMHNARSLFCIILMLLAQVHASAQKVDIGDGELNDALAQHRLAFDELAASRGIMVGRERSNSPGTPGNSSFITGARPIGVNAVLTRQQISVALKQEYPESTALLFYAYQSNALRVWLIDADGIRAYGQVTKSKSELSAAIADVRASLAVDTLRVNRVLLPTVVQDEPARKNEPRLPLNLAIRNLTGILLPSSVALELNNVRHLMVAPVLDIGIVPFAILRPFGNETYLIDKMSVSIVPNAYDVINKIEVWNPDFRNSLVVGNPFFPSSRKWTVRPLPGAEREARYVAGVLNANPLIGKGATKEQVIELAKTADLLYFATHGIASINDPLSGGFLMLTADTQEMGRWTAKEIQGSTFSARLAVLSACQTGLGKVHNAGIIGLSRAFQIAGVPRVAMSLWSIGDNSTSDLMKAFVRYLRQHVPAEALRLAMLDVRKQQSDPAKWASFVIFGTPR